MVAVPARMRSPDTAAVKSKPDFSIITPSYNMLGYLKRCCASIRDQEGVSVEHIVVDGDSSDGTLAWLATQPHLTVISGQDEGMYDAINKGLALAKGEIVAYLNCDEQYLPGTLRAVRDRFVAEPDADAVYGDTLVIEDTGDLIAYRKTPPLRWPYILSSYLYVLSASLFLDGSLFRDGLRFDHELKAVGDADLVVRLLRAGRTFVHIRKYLSVFTVTGGNKITSAESRLEIANYLRSAPAWIRALRAPLNVARYAERLLYGVYHERTPLSYEVYTDHDPARRKQFQVDKASFRFAW